MNKNLKIVLSFLAGAGSGAGITFYILKSKYEKDMAEEATKLKNYYDESYASQIEDLQNKLLLAESGGKARPATNEKAPKKTVKRASSKDVAVKDDDKPQKVDYNAISKDETSGKKVVKHKATKLAGPQIITFDDYTTDKKHEKVTYTYLDQEDMLIDENYDPISSELEDEVGTDFKDVDNGPDGDNRYVYVRNDSCGKDFEIIIDVYHTFKSFLAEEGC